MGYDVPQNFGAVPGNGILLNPIAMQHGNYITRIATQVLEDTDGDEKTALDSVFSLFSITRLIIKAHGRDCIEFTKLAIVVLNQIIRPFTAKWHKISIQGGFSNQKTCKEFRAELAQLQGFLRTYTRMLADMAGVEDLTELEK